MPQQRSEETRQGILQAALDSFSRQGYDAASVAEICALAGVSKGAFYYHFPTKQGLFLALIEDWLKNLDRRLQQAQISADRVPTALLMMSGELEQIFTQAEGRLGMFLEFWRQASRDPQVWALLISPYRRYQDWFAGLIETGIREGSLRQIDPQVASRLLVATAVGMLLQGLLEPQGTDWPATTRGSLELLLQGLEMERS